jgi:hypothetical protein
VPRISRYLSWGSPHFARLGPLRKCQGRCAQVGRPWYRPPSEPSSRRQAATPQRGFGLGAAARSRERSRCP